MKSRTSPEYTILLTAALMFFTLSLSIAVPLLCRSFYYAHISSMHLPEMTGYTAEQIRQAYDEMMDFCMYGAPFGTGVLKWSVSGMEHFADCAVLFRLDLTVLKLSGMVLLLCAAAYRMGIRAGGIRNRGPFFWSGSLLAGGFLVIAGLASLNFDRAFIVFHQLFFPGKDNWIFDPSVDEIINILPQEFFRNCAILIVGVLFVLCALQIAADFLLKRKKAEDLQQ